MTSTERALKALPLVILSIAGCSAVAVRLGIRTRLDTVPVASASVSLFSTNGKSALTALAPGQTANLVVDVLTQDRRHLKSVGAEAGTVLFDSFTITPSLITVDKHGRVAMPEDPRLSEHKSGRLNLSVVGQPGVTANLDIPLRYDIAYVANYSGRNGSDGINGSSGADGHSGSSGPPGDFDPKTGVHGSQRFGRNGRAGSDGRPGQGGRPGKIFVTVDPGANLYIDHLSFQNRDGNGRAGPPPQIVTAPVAALW